MTAKKASGGRDSGRRSSLRGRAALAGAAALTTMCIYQSPAYARIKGAQVVAGSAQIRQNGANTTIRATDGAIIRYQQFNLTRAESVRFVQPGADARVLNRIDGAAPSKIDGRVTANGIVYFVNPAGVFFGPNSILNVGQLYAAGGNISDSDFQNRVNRFTAVGGPVTNMGTMRAEAVHLIGSRVLNSGNIVARGGVVTMTAGDDVLMAEAGSQVMVKVGTLSDAGAKVAAMPVSATGAGDLFSIAVRNSGNVKANQIQVKAAAGAAVVSGKLDASNTQGKGGDVAILGDKVALVGARVDASGSTGGGTVLVGGDFQGGGDVQRASKTLINSTSAIRADATVGGDGGKVVVWADGTTSFAGRISAKGGPEGGNGGLVEVSGKEALRFTGDVVTTAPNGEQGTLLLDPDDIVISDEASGAGADDAELDNNVPGGRPAGEVQFADGAGTFTISAGKLESLAAGTNIILQANNTITMDPLTTAGKGGVNGELTLGTTGSVSMTTTTGAINLGANTIRTAGASFTLSAGTDITVGPILTNGGAAVTGGAVSLTAGTGGVSGALSIQGISTNGSANGGNVVLSALQGITVNGAVNAGNATITASANTGGAGAGSFTMNSGTSLLTSNATAGAVSIQVNAAGGGTGGAQLGAITTGAGGTITVDTSTGGNSTGGSITQVSGNLNTGTGTVTLKTGDAASSIGVNGTHVQTNTGTLNATTGSGGVFVTETNGLTIGTVSTTGDVTLNAGGNISIPNNGITAENVTIAATGGGIVSAAAPDGTAEIVADGDVSLTGTSVGGVSQLELGGDGSADSPLTISATGAGNVNVLAVTDQFNSLSVTLANALSNADVVLPGPKIMHVVGGAGSTVNTVDLPAGMDFTFRLADSAADVTIVTGGIVASGPVRIEANRNIVIGDGPGAAIDASGGAFDVRVTADVDGNGTGAITDGGGTIDMSGGGTLALRAGSGIGVSGTPIQLVGVGDLAAATSTSGGVFLANGTSGDVNVTTVDLLSGLSSNNGEISLVNSAGSITLGATGTIDSGGGNITLRGSGITQNTGGTITADAGSVLIDGEGGAIDLKNAITTADGGITIRDATTAVLGNLNSTGTLTLGVGQDITGAVTQSPVALLNVGTLTASTADALTLGNDNLIGTVGAVTRGGSLTIKDTAGGLTITGPITAGTITNAVDISTAGGALAVNGNISTSGANNITLTGAGVTAGAVAVNASTGQLLVDGGAGAIDLGTSTLTADGGITIRNATTVALGNLNTAGTLTLGVGQDITSAVTQTAATAINASSVTASTAGSITLDLANVIATLDAVVRGGALTVNDSTLGLTVNGPITGGTIDNSVSITTAGGALSLAGNISSTGAANSISLAGPGVTLGNTVIVDAGAGQVLIDGNGGAIEMGTSTITGDGGITLRDATTVALSNLNSAGTLTLGVGQDVTSAVTQNATTAMDVGDLAASTAGSITLGNTNLIGSIGAVTRGGALTVNDTAGGLTVNGPITGGTTTNEVSLTTAGGVLDIAGNIATSGVNDVVLSGDGVSIAGSITSGDELRITSTADITGSGSVNIAGLTTLSAGAAGAIQLENTSNVFTGDFTIAAGFSAALFDTTPILVPGCNLAGPLRLTSNGTIGQSAPLIASSITAKTLNNAGAAITLTDAANNAASIQLSARNAADNAAAAGTISYRDTNGYSVLGIDTSANATLRSGAAVTQLGSIHAAGLELLGSGPYTLDIVANNVAMLAGNVPADVKFRNGTALWIGTVNTVGLTVTGNLELRGDGIQQTQLVSVTGATTLRADTQIIDLSTLANAFGGTVSVPAGTNAMLQDNGALEFGNVDITGNLVIIAAGGITQAAGTSMLVDGITSLQLPAANDVVLENTGNDFGGTVMVAPMTNLRLRDSSALTLSGATVSGNLALTSNGLLQSTGVLNVTGLTTLASGSGDILVDQANVFGGAVTITSGRDATVRDTNAIEFDGVNITRNLAVQSVGTITDGAGAMVVGGTTSLDAGAATNDITLDNPANNFGGAVSVVSGQNVTLVDANAIVLGNINAGPTLVVTAGGVTQGAGTSILADVFALNSSAGVVLDEAGNDINTISGTSVGAFTFRDADGFTVNAIDSGGGDITLTAVTGDITQGTGAVAAGAGKASLVALAGSVLDSTVDNVADATGATVALSAGPAGTIGSVADSFDTTAGTLQLTGGSGGIYVRDTDSPTLTDFVGTDGDLNLVAANSLAITVPLIDLLAGPGSVTLQSLNGPLTASGDITTDTGSINLTASAALTIGGNLTTAGGAINLIGSPITQLSSSTIDVGLGAILIDGNAGAIDLAGTVTADGGITVRDATTVALGNMNTSGVLTLGVGQDITDAVTQNAGTALNVATLTASTAGSITLGNDNLVGTLGAITRGGALLVNDTAGGLIVSADIGAAAGSDGITLATAGGALAINANLTTGSGGMSLSGTSVNIAAGSTVNSGGGLSVVALHGDVQADGRVIVAGSTTLLASSANDLLLTNATNDFVGPVGIMGGRNADIRDANALVAGPISLSGDLTLTAGGAITQSDAIDATALTAKTLNDAGASITLDNAGNEVDTVALAARNAADAANAAGNLSYRDATDFVVASIATGGNATLWSGAAVSQSGAIEAAGLELLGSGPYILTDASNAISTVAGNVSGGVTLVNGTDLTIGAVNTSGLATGGALDVTLAAGRTLGQTHNVTAFTDTTFTADEIDLNGGASSVAGAGVLTIQPTAANVSIDVGSPAGGSGTLDFSDTDVAALTDGFSQIFIGRSDGTHAINVETASFKDMLTIRSANAPGSIRIAGLDTLGASDAGSITVLGTGSTTTLAGAIRTQGAPILIDDRVVLSADSTLATNVGAAAGADITITGAVEGPAGLTMNAGTGGNIALNSAVGAGTRASQINFENANDVVAGAITAGRIDQVAGSGLTTLGALDTNAAAGTHLAGTTFHLTGPVVATGGGGMSITHSGTLTISGAADMTLSGPFIESGGGLVSTAGDIAMTAANDVEFHSPVELTANVAINTAGGTVRTFSTVNGAFDLGITGNAVFGDGAGDFVGNSEALNTLNVSGSTRFNAGNTGANTVRTSVSQAYGDVTLGANTTLLSPTLTFNGTIDGARALLLDGNATIYGFVGDTTPPLSLTVTGTTSLYRGYLPPAGVITSYTVLTAGPQVYTGDVTLGASTALNGLSVRFGGRIDGVMADAQGLIIHSDATFDGLIGSSMRLASVTVSGASALNAGSAGGNTVSTSGVQDYGGPVALGGSTVLAGSTITFRERVDGAQTLGIIGNAVLGDSAGDFVGSIDLLESLDISGTTAFNGGNAGAATVRTRLDQHYGGNATLGADTTLSATGARVRFDGTVNGGRALNIQANAVFGDQPNDFVGNTTALTSLSVAGTTRLNAGDAGAATVRTTGAQDYTGAVTLGASTTLEGSTVSFSDAVDGIVPDVQVLAITGDAVFGDGLGDNVGGVTRLHSLSVSGTTRIRAGNQAGDAESIGVFTRNQQVYGGDVTLGADAHLSGSAIRFNGRVDGGRDLSILGDARFGDGAGDFVGSITPLTSLDVDGTTVLNAGNAGASTVRTAGTQRYRSNVTLGANTTLTASAVQIDGTIDGAFTLRIEGDANLNGEAGGTTPLASLDITGPVRMNAGAVTTTGDQRYRGAMTLASDAALTGRNLRLDRAVTGASALDLDGSTSIVLGGNADVASLTAAAPGISVQRVETTGDITLISSPVADGGDPARMLSLHGNLISGGDIRLNPGEVATVPTTATIAGYPGAGNLLLQADGDVLFGHNQKFSVLGGLQIEAARAVLSDISVLNDLTVTASSIQVRRRSEGFVLTPSGGVVRDNGLDFAAGGAINFGQTPITQFNAAAEPGPRERFGTESGANFTLAIPAGEQKPQTFRLTEPIQLTRGETVLDGVVQGQPTTIVPVTAPKESKQAEMDQGVSMVVAEKLADLGIYLRSLSVEQIIAFLEGMAIYEDVPWKAVAGGEPVDKYEVTRNRISRPAVQLLLSKYYQTYFDASGESRVLQMSSSIQKAVDEYLRATKQTRVTDAVAFRQYVEDHEDLSEARMYMDRLRELMNMILGVGEGNARLGVGLSMNEAAYSRKVILSRLNIRTGINLDVLEAAILAQPQRPQGQADGQKEAETPLSTER